MRSRIARPGLQGLLLLVLLLVGCSGSNQRRSGETAVSARRSLGTVMTAEDIENGRTVNSVGELLQLMPGIFVRGGMGAESVRLQGRQGSPLFVINGIPMPDASSAMSLNPRDVDRIEILKDGGSTAEYGFRGSNGVILIRTKR